MGLPRLEYTECLTDSPFFRLKLYEHEQELLRTNKAIKTFIQNGKQVVDATKQLSKAQRLFAKNLMEFKFDYIDQQSDNEMSIIAPSLHEFGGHILEIEDARMKLIDLEEQFVKRLETFRKDNFGAAKKVKKNFDKQTSKFCQSQERFLSMKTKISDSQLKEAEEQVEIEKQELYQTSMSYVCKLLEVQERKKFEFVEMLEGHLLSWMSFYHEGYEHLEDFRNFDVTLTSHLQKIREHFEADIDKTKNQIEKLLEASKARSLEKTATGRGFNRDGYLFLLEKKVIGTAWTKYYCQYWNDTKELSLTSYNSSGKSGDPEQSKYIIDSCVARPAETTERRFCFDIITKDKQTTMMFQALSESDRQLWFDAFDARLDGSEPVVFQLDDAGFNFMKKSIASIEKRGLEESGLYRLAGMSSRVSALVSCALDPSKSHTVNFDDEETWDTHTIASAVKQYLRLLQEPLMTVKLQEEFLKASRQDSGSKRILGLQKCINQLPKVNFNMLDLIIGHLQSISKMSKENKMTESNLAVCFGPTLMRPDGDSVSATLECNYVVELLVTNYTKIFKEPSHGASGTVVVPKSPVSPNGDDSGSSLMTVITRFPCCARSDTELSFEPNQKIINVRRSQEAGWLLGELNGKVGLIPENFVTFVDP